MNTLLEAYSHYEVARKKLLAAQQKYAVGAETPLLMRDIRHLLAPNCPEDIIVLANVVLQQHVDLDPCQLIHRRRRAPESLARHILYYLCRHYTNHSSTYVGQLLMREHKSILHGVQRVTDRESVDAAFAARLRTIRIAAAEALKIQ